MRTASVCHYFPKSLRPCSVSSQAVAGPGSETHQAALGWCSASHTVLPCPCTLCCKGFHPSRNALPIMRVRGQSAAAPGGRDLLGTLSH